jgi:hypothetical protein
MRFSKFNFSGVALGFIAALVFSGCFGDTSSDPYSNRNMAMRGNADSTYYYQIDTVKHEIYQHSRGQCNMGTGSNLQWDSSVDATSLAYKYTFSNDTLYLKSDDQSVLVKTSGTSGSLDGTWKVVRYFNGLGNEVPGESSGLVANRVITISGDSFKESCELASTFDFTKSMGLLAAMRFAFDAQDGKDNGNGSESGNSFFIKSEPYVENTYEYTVVSRTNTSIEIVRNGRTFLFEIIDPKVSLFEKSMTYKLTSNGMTCTFNYESFPITKETCDLNHPEPLVFNNNGKTVYGVETSNHYSFESCFHKMFK